jgi:hypothetical protein
MTPSIGRILDRKDLRRVEKLGHELRRRLGAKLCGSATLDDFSLLENEELGAKGLGVACVVSHHDRRDPLVPQAIDQEGAQSSARSRVQGRQGLVEEQELGFDDQRARERDPLLLATG